MIDFAFDALVAILIVNFVLGSLLEYASMLSFVFGYVSSQVLISCFQDELYETESSSWKLYKKFLLSSCCGFTGLALAIICSRGNLFVYIFFALFIYDSCGWEWIVKSMETHNTRPWPRTFAVMKHVVSATIVSTAVLAFASPVPVDETRDFVVSHLKLDSFVCVLLTLMRELSRRLGRPLYVYNLIACWVISLSYLGFIRLDFILFVPFLLSSVWFLISPKNESSYTAIVAVFCVIFSDTSRSMLSKMFDPNDSLPLVAVVTFTIATSFLTRAGQC